MGDETAGVERMRADEYEVVSGVTDASDFPTSDYYNAGHEGLIVWLDVNSIGGTSPSIDITVEGLSPTGTYYTLITKTGVSSTGLTTLQVNPSLPNSAGDTQAEMVPPRWRIKVTVDTADGDETYDYDVSYAYR